MDIELPGIRDRRTAASDETTTVKDGTLYGRRSNARQTGAMGATFDREPEQLYSIILHQTAGSFFDRERRSSRRSLPPSASDDSQVGSNHDIDRIGAHFVVMSDGQVFYTHDIQFMLSDNRQGTIEIEFAGKYTRNNRLPTAAIVAGRHLVHALKRQIPTITNIHPHGQVQTRDKQGICGGSTPNRCDKLGSCPGPDIWMNIGTWAVEQLELICTQTRPELQNNGIARSQTRISMLREFTADEILLHPELAGSRAITRPIDSTIPGTRGSGRNRHVGPVGAHDHTAEFNRLIRYLAR